MILGARRNDPRSAQCYDSSPHGLDTAYLPTLRGTFVQRRQGTHAAVRMGIRGRSMERSVEYGSFAKLFGQNSMEAWTRSLLEDRRCMDCKAEIEGFEGAMDCKAEIEGFEGAMVSPAAGPRVSILSGISMRRAGSGGRRSGVTASLSLPGREHGPGTRGPSPGSSH